MGTVPTIDISPLIDRRSTEAARQVVGADIGLACERYGFFQIVGHGVDPELRRDLRRAADAFFSLDPEEKGRIAMRHGGRAWRGWFGVGDELTSASRTARRGSTSARSSRPSIPRSARGDRCTDPTSSPNAPQSSVTSSFRGWTR